MRIEIPVRDGVEDDYSDCTISHKLDYFRSAFDITELSSDECEKVVRDFIERERERNINEKVLLIICAREAKADIGLPVAGL